jgi:L-histidine Nalpha-methyltransferase
MIELIDLVQPDSAAALHELAQGLLAPQATLSPKHFYDPLGSRLFEAICELPEYYPTRTEGAVLATHAQSLAHTLPQQAVWIDMGAGNCVKAARLLASLPPQACAGYCAVDISVAFLHAALQAMRQQPGVAAAWPMRAMGLDFSQPHALSAAVATHGLPGPTQAARVVFYPGSSIGNFNPPQALALLHDWHAVAAATPGGGLLIGVDLIKDRQELIAAYDDALGVTAAFNLNVLRRVNALLGADLRVADWAHRAVFDDAHQRVEMHLVAGRDVQLHSPHVSRHWAAGEYIHTENAHKYTVPGFADLLRQAGYAAPLHWTDAAQRFAVFWAPAVAP